MLQWCMVEAVRAMLLLRLRRLLVMLVGLLMRSLVLVRRRRMVLTHDTEASTRVSWQMMRRELVLTRLHLVAHQLRLVRRLASVLCEVERVRLMRRRRQVLQRVRRLWHRVVLLRTHRLRLRLQRRRVVRRLMRQLRSQVRRPCLSRCST